MPAREFVVGVISDTHGLLRPEALDVLRGSDMIIHAGDVGKPEVIDRLGEVPDPGAEPAELWEQECQRQLFAWAAEQVRPRFQPASWQAFWRTAVDGARGTDVAKELEMTVAAVYLAKGRVMAAIKKQIDAVEEEK